MCTYTHNSHQYLPILSARTVYTHIHIHTHTHQKVPTYPTVHTPNTHTSTQYTVHTTVLLLLPPPPPPLPARTIHTTRAHFSHTTAHAHLPPPTPTPTPTFPHILLRSHPPTSLLLHYTQLCLITLSHKYHTPLQQRSLIFQQVRLPNISNLPFLIPKEYNYLSRVYRFSFSIIVFALSHFSAHFCCCFRSSSVVKLHSLSPTSPYLGRSSDLALTRLFLTVNSTLTQQPFRKLSINHRKFLINRHSFIHPLRFPVASDLDLHRHTPTTSRTHHTSTRFHPHKSSHICRALLQRAIAQPPPNPVAPTLHRATTGSQSCLCSSRANWLNLN